MKKTILIFLIIFSNNIFSQLSKINSKTNCLNGYITEIAKLSESDSQILNDLKSNLFTTQIIFKCTNGELLKLIINDKDFNYDYFNKNVYENFKKVNVKIKTRKLKIKNNDFIILNNIKVNTK